MSTVSFILALTLLILPPSRNVSSLSPLSPPSIPIVSLQNLTHVLTFYHPLSCSIPIPFPITLPTSSDIEYFSQAGFDMDHIQLRRNAPVAELYEDAIRYEGAVISSSGALINFSGACLLDVSWGPLFLASLLPPTIVTRAKVRIHFFSHGMGGRNVTQKNTLHDTGKKTGRSPKDKRIVFEDSSKDDIWWGPVNIKMDERESLSFSTYFRSVGLCCRKSEGLHFDPLVFLPSSCLPFLARGRMIHRLAYVLRIS